MQKPKVCIVHDFLVEFGGAEKTVEALAEIFPEAPIYTALYKPQKMEGVLKNRKIISANSVSDKLFSIIPIFSKYLTFLLPIVFENFDLSDYDIIISSSSSYAKGVITKPSQLHISYIHTPPRFLYGYSVQSTKRNAWYYKPFVNIIDHFLRIWDYLAAQRADYIITNSKNVKGRIGKFYKRDAKVIYPPVETKYKNIKGKGDNLEQPYYLALGRLAAYKNFDLIIKGFNLIGKPLKIIGTGTEKRHLKRIANENIEFLGRVSDEEKHKIIKDSLGLIFPVEDEDFGIVPIEAMIHGKPILAHKSGGPKETIRGGVDGILFENLELEEFAEKLREFDKKVHNGFFNAEKIKERSKNFSKEKFKQEFENFVTTKWDEKLSDN